MKNIFFSLMMLSSVAYSQVVDYDDVIPLKTSDSLTFEDKLVRLAWLNYPVNRNFELEVSRTKEDVFQAKWSWINNLGVNYQFSNQNFGNVPAADSTGTGLYPRYGFGLSLNLGSLVFAPSKTRQAKADLKMAQNDLKTQMLAVRAEVIRRYQAYLLAVDQLKVRTQAVEDYYTTNLMITEKFKKGEATLEDYNDNIITYNDMVADKITSQSEIVIRKATLEEMIGIKLEQVR